MVRRRCHGLQQLEPRRLPRCRDQVVHEVGADAVALVIESDELHRRHRIPLGQPAVNLPFDDHRVDPHAAVVQRHHALHVPLSGLGIDLDHDDIGTERERHVGRVVVVHALQTGLEVVRRVGVGGECDLLDGRAAVRRTLHVESSWFPLQVLRRGFQQMGRDQPGLVAQLAGDHGGRCATDRCRSRGIGAETVGRVVGVALLHRDVAGGDAELVGDDLRERRLVALSLRLDAELEDRLAGRVHAQLSGVEHLDPGDVEVLVVAGAHDFGEAGDADADQPTLLARLRLLLAQVLVADGVERLAQCGRIVTGVVDEAGCGGVGELLGLDEVAHAQVSRVDAELVRRVLHQSLDQVRRLGDPERASVGHAAGRLVGVGALRHDVRCGHVVGAGDDVEQAGAELRRLSVGEEGTVVGQHVHAQREHLALARQRQLAVHVVVAGEAR